MSLWVTRKDLEEKIKLKLNRNCLVSQIAPGKSASLHQVHRWLFNASFFMLKEERNCPNLMTPCSEQRMLNT